MPVFGESMLIFDPRRAAKDRHALAKNHHSVEAGL
jgi:hypothetical protein